MPNRVSALLEERRARGLAVTDLTLSNPTQAGLAYPEREILEALGEARALRYEPSPRGLREAREAIAAHHARQGCKLDPERVVLAGSTSESYSWIFKLLCEPGDEVVAPRPSYPLFECLASLEAVRCVSYSLDERRGWAIDFESLEAALTPRTRAMLLVNPNNPTGSYLTREDWRRLLALAARRGVAIVSDEVFFDYARGAAAERVTAAEEQDEAIVFLLSGLSKIAGLPQMKLGWVHVSGPRALREQALERLEWIADAYLPVSAPVEHACARWLALAPAIQAAVRERCVASRSALAAALPAESGCRVLESEGGWCAVVEVPRIRSEEAWALALLERHGTLVQPGYFYDFEREGLLVVSLLPKPEDLAAGAAAMASLARSQ